MGFISKFIRFFENLGVQKYTFALRFNIFVERDALVRCEETKKTGQGWYNIPHRSIGNGLTDAKRPYLKGTLLSV
jgi:hypothetical protein